MKDLNVVRKYEWVFVLCSTIAYVSRSLMENASHFDSYVGTAQSIGLPVSLILSDLSEYNNVTNYNLPVIFSALFCFAAWSVFHYIAYPKLKSENWTRPGFDYLLLSLLLTTASIFILTFFTKYFDFRQDGNEDPIGFKVFSNFRLLFVITGLLSTFTLFCIYEFLSQLYYDFYKDDLSKPLQFLNYFIIFLAISISIIIALNGLFSIFYRSVGLQQTLTLALGGVFTFLLRDYFAHQVSPQLHSLSATISDLKNLAIYISLCLATSVIVWGLFTSFGQFIHTPVAFALIFIILVLAPILLSYFIHKETTVLQTAVSNKSAELSNLRQQINPHFLFNALNSLYATALIENSEKTADGIQKLGDMMRFMLHENNHDRIPLRSEISYLHNYIDLQRMRLDETQNIEIRVNIQEAEREIYIAPMLLNPFIENAFKHGISFQNSSWIYITLTMDASKIYFKVHNSIHKTASKDPEESHSGIGLENVKKRLDLIYPSKHTLDIQKSERDYFIALTLNW